MAFQRFLLGAGKQLAETAKVVTGSKSPVDALSMAMGNLAFGGAASTESTDTVSSSSYHRGSAGNNATSTPTHIPSPLSRKVVSAQQSTSAAQSPQQEEEDEENDENDEEDELEDEEEADEGEVNEHEQNKENNYSSQAPGREPQYSKEQTAVNRQHRMDRLKERRTKATSAIGALQNSIPRALDESLSRNSWSSERENGFVASPSRIPARRGTSGVAPGRSGGDADAEAEAEESVYGTESTRPTFAYNDAEQDENDNPYTSYDPYKPYFTPTGNSYPEYTYSAAKTSTAPRDVGEDGLEEYHSDSEEIPPASGSANKSFRNTRPVASSSGIPTISTVTEEQALDDDSDPQLFLDNILANAIKSDSQYMEFAHSDPLTGPHFLYDTPADPLSHAASSASLPRSLSAFTAATPLTTSGLDRISVDTNATIYSNENPSSKAEATTSQGGVDRHKRTIRVHHGRAPYQRHRPNYVPDPFTPPYIPTAVIGTVNGDVPRVDWSTPIPTPSAVNLTSSDDETRDMEMTVLDQTMERYYWDERAAAMWARDEAQREAIRQNTVSIDFMQALNTFAASHPPNFITRRLQELDDILTPQMFRDSPPNLNTINLPRINTYLAQVRTPTLDEEATYHEAIQRYRDIYKGYRLFAARYELPFGNTILDFDADVNMLGPNELVYLPVN